MFPRITAFFRALRGDTAGNVAVISVNGPIMAGRRGRQSVNLENMERQIAKAFSLPNLKAVALSINSPGGSPVQSAMIMQTIRELADKKHVPVIAYAEDVAASGGYMIALAGDEIIAHPASLVGSIGVIYAGFGFEDLIKKYGVKRRIHTAGKNKAFMDPFSAEKKTDVARLKGLQNDLFKYFQDLVVERRGKRLKGAKPKVFNGDIWTAEEAKKLGIIDNVGDLRAALHERFGEKVRIVRIAPPKPMFSSFLSGSAKASGGPLLSADDVLEAIEARLHWSRWGL